MKLTNKFKKIETSKAYSNTSLYNNSLELIHIILIENGVTTQRCQLKPKQIEILPSVAWLRVILARADKKTGELIVSK